MKQNIVFHHYLVPSESSHKNNIIQAYRIENPVTENTDWLIGTHNQMLFWNQTATIAFDIWNTQR